VYAETHAEQSPSTGLHELPHGRRSLYFLAYLQDKAAEDLTHLDGKAADQVTFLEAWRFELPHVTVAKAEGSFTKCGTCEYLKGLMDSNPRGQGSLGEIARSRLGQHYQFQGAQRIKMAYYEEQARRSGGEVWILKLDVMDHSNTVLPTVWSQPGPCLVAHHIAEHIRFLLSVIFAL
jgi:hypothetical protein